MTAEHEPDFIYAGPSRSGSSWMSEALKEHPEIYMPDLKPVNFFNVKYHLGMRWYRSVFEDATADQLVGESSPPYIMNERAPERVAEHLDDVVVVFSLRNPISRAFSHWWYDTVTGITNSDFEDVLFADEFYELYIRMGMYVDHLERWYDHLSRDRVGVFLFDDFVEDNAAFISSVYEFVGADPSYEPSIVGQRVNQAKQRGPELYDRFKPWLLYEAPDWCRSLLKALLPKLDARLESKAVYDAGLDEHIRKELELVYAEPTNRLANLIDRDLDHWFEHISLDDGDYRSQVVFPEEYKSAHRHWESDYSIGKNYKRRRGVVSTGDR